MIPRVVPTPAPPAPAPSVPLSQSAIELLAELMRQAPAPEPEPAWDRMVADASKTEPIYSTFGDGKDMPDEWPPPEHPPTRHVELLAATMAAMVATIIGLIRSHLRRLRI